MSSVNPLNDVTVPLPPGTSTTQDTTQGLGTDTFLKLLVAQMKYQNPMNPTDTTQFMAQTAQFSMVEKLTDIDKQMTSLAQSQENVVASGMVGKSIVATGASGKDITGIVTGMKITADGPVVKIGDMEIAYNKVKEVDQPPAPAPTTAPATSTTPSTTTA